MAGSCPTRRSVIGVLASSMVTACVPFGKTSPFWGTMAAGFTGSGGAPVTRAHAEQLPYASMLAWFDGAAPAFVVLAEFAANRRLIWHTAERQSLTTFGAYVVGAIGFDLELRGTQFAGTWQENPLLLDGRQLRRTIDVAAEGERVQVLLESRFAAREEERVAILDRDYRLKRVVETVSSRGQRRYKNEYWVEVATGRCWKSKQIVVPTLPHLNIEILKYPSA